MPNDVGYLSELADRASRSGRVTLREPLPYEELVPVLNGYDLGIHVIPPVNFNNTWALPNKFFDYIQARLAIIIGPSAEMARTLREYDLGVVADGFDAAAITAVLDRLEPELVWQWKCNADASAGTLSADSQIAVWDRAIAALAARVGDRTAR